MYRPIAALVAVTLLVVLSSHVLDAQQPDAEPFAADGIPAVSLPDPPVEYRTAEGQRIRVSVVTTGLTYPWGLAFLPDGSALVTERLGTLRVIREGVLDPSPLSGVPVTQGPDGLIYVLTGGSFLGLDQARGGAALLRIEPVE